MSWNGVITNAGRNFLAQQLAADKAVIIDEIQCGSGVVAGNAMKAATGLSTAVCAGYISSQKNSGEVVQIGAQVRSHTVSYVLREIGIFAFDQNKSTSSRTLLILLQNADGVSIPESATFPDFLYTLTVAMPVSNASNITVNINQNAVVDALTYAEKVATLTEGPNSSTDNHIALFDGTTGKRLKDSGQTLPVVMTGATVSVAGASGLVPAPAAGGQNKVLLGGGTWSDTIDSLKVTSNFSMGRASGSTVGVNSSAEGNSVTASGANSHAEGNGTAATGANSHAEGNNTRANGAEQHVFGRFNVADTTSAEIVGNGTADGDRKNARTLDWSGNETLAGDLTIKNSTNSPISVSTLGKKAGASESSSKLFLIGATSQAESVQTYTHDTAYVGTDGALYSGGEKTVVDSQRPFCIGVSATSSPYTISNSKITASHRVIAETPVSWNANVAWETGAGWCKLTCSAGIPAMYLMFYLPR